MKSIIFTHSSNRSYLTARPSSLPLALTKAATLYPSLLPSSISLHLRLDTGLEVQVLEDAWDSEGLERDQMQFTVRGEERGGNQSLGEGTSKRGREEEEEEENEKLPKEEGERAVKKGREEAPGWKGKGKGREGGEAGTPDEGEGEEDPRATTVTLREPGCEDLVMKLRLDTKFSRVLKHYAKQREVDIGVLSLQWDDIVIRQEAIGPALEAEGCTLASLDPALSAVEWRGEVFDVARSAGV